jgi:hypothetical protein
MRLNAMHLNKVTIPAQKKEKIACRKADWLSEDTGSIPVLVL